VTFSEATTIAAKLIEQYPNMDKNAGPGFLSSLAELLTIYPREVALAAAGAKDGIASKHEWLSLAVVAKWCSKKADPLHEQAARELREHRQLETRVESRRNPIIGMTWKQMEDWHRENNKPCRPAGAFEKGSYLGESAP
jgi:hypothetical protein